MIINSTLRLGVGRRGGGGRGGYRITDLGGIGGLSSHHCSSHPGGVNGILQFEFTEVKGELPSPLGTFSPSMNAGYSIYKIIGDCEV